MSVVPSPGPAPGAGAGGLAALEDDGWVVLHDLRWPGRLRRPVERVLVGPGGVVVLDAQHWTGRVSVDAGVLRTGRRPRDRECAAAADAAAAVASLLHPEHHGAVRAVLWLAGAPVPATPVRSGVLVAGAAELLRWVEQLPRTLDDDDVHRLAAHLRWQLGGAAAPDGEGPAAVVPVTRRALREAERRAEKLARRGVLSRQRARPGRAPAPAGGSPRLP